MAKKLKTKADDPINLQPTPAVGESLIWYPAAQEHNGPRACICTDIEGPGQIAVTVFGKNAVPIHKSGVLHMDNTRHILKPAQSVNGGGWDFPKVPDDYYQFDRDDRERRELAKMKAEDEALAAAERRKQQVLDAKETSKVMA